MILVTHADGDHFGSQETARAALETGAIEAHVAALEKVQQEFAPRYVFPNHLIHCQWTIDPAVLRGAVRQRGLQGIVIMEDEKQVFET